jgi:hypothetical protein
MKRKLIFIKICFYIGAVIDFIAMLPLLFPGLAVIMFGLNPHVFSEEYLYVSRIGASLMAGWTILLVWGSLKPVERKGLLLITVCPVLAGLIVSSILVVASGFIKLQFILPLWILYAVIVPMYIAAYMIAGKIKSE